MSANLFRSEFAGRGLQYVERYQIFPILQPAFDLDREAPAESFFQFIDREMHVAVPARDHGVVLIEAVPLLMPVAACAGVEEGDRVLVHLDHEKADVPALVPIGEEPGNVGRELGNIDNHVLSRYDGAWVDRLPCAGGGSHESDRAESDHGDVSDEGAKTGIVHAMIEDPSPVTGEGIRFADCSSDPGFRVG